MNDHPLVVTGASGFIGRNLLRRLCNTRLQVCALVRGSADRLPTASNLSIKRVSRYCDHIPAPGAVLVHLGEPSHIVGLETTPHIEAMVAQAEALLRREYMCVVYASSATVYSDDHDVELPTDAPVRLGRKIYADSKIEVEKLLSKAGGIIARVTNVYGRGMSDINIFSDILAQLSQTGPLKIREATPIREYLWVDDLTECLTAMACNPVSGTYNVSTNEPISCADLAKKILERAGQTGRPVEAQLPPRRSVLRLDTRKTEKTFGWRPKVSLVMGIDTLLKDVGDE